MQAETSIPPPISFPVPRKRRLFTAFEIVVVLLGLLALAYLISTLMRPAFVAQLLGATVAPKTQTADKAKPAVPVPPRDLTGSLAEIASRRQADMQMDAARSQADADLAAEREAADAAQRAAQDQGTSQTPHGPSTAALEAERALARVGQDHGTAAPAATASTSGTYPDGVTTSTPPATVAEVDLPPTPGALVTGSVSKEPPKPSSSDAASSGPTLINASGADAKKPPQAAPAKIAPAQAKEAATPVKPAPSKEPPKVAAKPAPAAKVAAAAPPSDVIAFGPAVVSKSPPPPEIVGIKIMGRDTSIENARLRWLMVTTEHGELMKGLEGRYVADAGANGAAYDIVAGPINSPTEARKVCKSLQAKGLSCAVGPFIGNAL